VLGVNGRIETGKWYDIRIELDGNNIKCFLDGKLIHDVQVADQQALHASATSVPDEVILKVVNVSDQVQVTDINLRGVTKVGGKAAVTVLTSAESTDENTLDQPTKVAPVKQTIEVGGTSFQHPFPANSVSILRITATKE
jgi:alpha-L-arabinofuranosidase